MTCRRIGSPGFLSRGSRLKKCGVTASASLPPERRTPFRSSSLTSICCSSCASEVTRLFSCHFQSFQSSGAICGQKPGACETNSFPSPFPRVCILSKDRNAKSAPICVNARTGKCAAHRVPVRILLTERLPKCRSESRQTTFSPFPPANECSRATPGNSAPRLRAFRNRDSSAA